MLNLATRQSINVAKQLAKNPIILACGFKNEVTPNVVWERPEKLKKYGRERSGDLAQYVPPDPSNICVNYRFGTELEE